MANWQARIGVAGVLLAAMITTVSTAQAATGRTQGSFNVSPTGAATYQIPISMPAGPKGLQPQLSIAYSSNSGDGTMGPGWYLSGLGNITRCNKTYAQDTTPAAVSLATTDGYCLNGNRLRLVSGGYGAAGSTYQTELADFSNITAYSASGNGPGYFIVQGKNGLLYEYGNSNDGGSTYPSRIMASGTSTPYQWLLSKVRDRAGNNYIVTYGAGQSGSIGVGVPLSISYVPSSAGSSSYNYSIAFAYGTDTATGTESGYVAGGSAVNNNRMVSISVQRGSTVVRRYNLGYGLASTTNRYRLDTVTECPGTVIDSTCLSSTAITYQNGTAGVSTTSSTALSSTTSVKGAYDFNGDGRQDILYLSGSVLYVTFANSSGFGSPVSTGITLASGDLYDAGDLVASGKDDILVSQSGYWYRYYWNGSAFSGMSTGVPKDSTDGTLYLMDINGDGLPDMVTGGTNNDAEYGGTTIYSRLNTSVSGVISWSSTRNTAFYDPPSYPPLVFRDRTVKMRPGNNTALKSLDFNGDGRQDLFWSFLIVYTDDNGNPVGTGGTVSYVLLSNGTTFSGGSTGQFSQAPVAYADWNNDRCTDIIYPASLYLSACNGNVASTVSYNGTFLATLDWNGDGRTDLLVNSGGYVGVYLSTGTGLSSLLTTSIPAPVSALVFDQNGDGLDDLGYIGTASPYAVTYRLHEGVGTPPDLVTSITDGYGVSYSPTYVSIAQSSVYTKGTGAVQPEKDVQDARYVVNQVSSSDGVTASGTYTQSFTYAGARSDIQGRDFLGFQSWTITDSRSSTPFLKTYYKTAFPYTGMAYQQDVYQHNGTTLISHSVNTPGLTTLNSTANNQRYFPYVVSTTTDSYEVGGSKNGLLIAQSAVSAIYDSSGNATSITNTLTDKDNSAPASPTYNQTWTKVVTNTITPNTANWCLSIPTQVTVQQYATGVSSITRTTSYTPDYVNCRITQQVTEPSSTAYKVTTVYGYDTSFGNVNSRTVTGNYNPATGTTMPARITLVNWNATGQFPINTTNAEGHYTQAGYDYNLGVQTSQTDPNGLITSWTYDSFGRKLTEVRPDGTSTAYSYNDCTTVSGGCQNGDPTSGATGINKMVVIATRKDTASTALRDDWTYLDQFDRTIVTKTKTLSGGYSRVGAQYDVLGRLYRRTVPCDAASCTAYWTTNTYDALGRVIASSRPISASNATLQTTTVAYQGMTTVTTDPQSKTTTKISDPNGWLRQSKDHNGYYQAFTYDAFGSLKTVTDSASNALFSANYAYGIGAFQTQTTDMDLGTWNYSPDALGEVTGYTDAKGSAFTMTYDKLSRLVTRYVAGEGTVTRTFGTSAANHNIGQLQSLTSTGGTTEVYTYDNQARLSQRAITADGTTYNYNYTYNSTTGLLDTLTYPTSTSSYRLALKYVYANGVLQQVKDNAAGTIFWQVNAMNPLGQITQETLGNGIVTNRSYDAVTGYINSIQSGVGGGTGVQNESYLFDKVGNVTQRQSNTLGLTESFYYDNLYRLDYSQLNGATNLDMTYDALGNITAKSDVGTYTYDAVKKHRLTGVTGGYTFSFDNNGNATSGLGTAVTWTAYNYPKAFTATSDTYMQFSYDANNARWKQIYSYMGDVDTTYYIGGLMEKWSFTGNTAYRHYIDVGGSRIVYTRWNTGQNETYYTSKDHLGSMARVTDASGNVAVGGSFKAFGERRATDWSANAPSSAEYNAMYSTDPSGFTGHEQLDGVNLVHMNGRVYAPWVGKFLSADPYITEPGNTQNYNRYSYVYNNPMSLTDPSGFSSCERDPDTGECLEEIDITGYPDPPPGDCGFGCGGFPHAPNDGGNPGDSHEEEMEEVVVEAGRETQDKQCMAMGRAISHVAGSMTSGAVAGGLSGGLAGALVGGALGTAAGVGDIASERLSSPNDNWGEVQAGTLTAMLVGGVSGGRNGGFTNRSGGIAGGAVAGFMGAAGMPSPIAEAFGGFVGGLGESGRSLTAISRNMLQGFRNGGLAGLAGLAVEMGGNYLTDIYCND